MFYFWWEGRHKKIHQILQLNAPQNKISFFVQPTPCCVLKLISIEARGAPPP